MRDRPDAASATTVGERVHARHVSGWRLAATVASVVVLVALGAFVWCERAGWPMLAQPAAQWLSTRLQREVQLTTVSGQGFALNLWGGLRLRVDQLQVANPDWADDRPMLLATHAEVQMRWRDLLWSPAGAPLRIERIQADTLQLRLIRADADRASWLFAPAPGQDNNSPARFNGVALGGLLVRDGSLSLDDALAHITLQGHFGVGEGAGLQADASGHYNNWPLKLTLSTGPTAAWWGGTTTPAAAPGRDEADVATRLTLSVGAVRLKADGQLRNPLHGPNFTARYDLQGPSLAAVGLPVGLTLPTTPPFQLAGRLVHGGDLWQTVVTRATIGRSALSGAFEYRHPRGQTPLLSGRLEGRVLWLADLGPAIGVPTEAGATGNPPTARAAGRLLPDRPFDLPSLRQMNANVLVDIDRFESGQSQLQAVSPLRAHIKLADAVLAIDDIDARLAQGRIRGRLQLDGRAPVALWQADLNARGLDLATWIAQPRAGGAPPYVTGRLAGQLALSGRGRSTAELLASSSGRARLQWTQGRISHLALEVAGLDLAQSLGVLLSGDDALPVDCAAADLRIQDGVARPEVLLVDTPDTTLWAEGAVSLATERLSLVLHANPKDLSPLALRSPLKLKGTFAQPDFSIDKASLLQRLLPAAGLAFINPLAALLPLIDTGDSKETAAAVSACQLLIKRHDRRATL